MCINIDDIIDIVDVCQNIPYEKRQHIIEEMLEKLGEKDD